MKSIPNRFHYVTAVAVLIVPVLVAVALSAVKPAMSAARADMIVQSSVSSGATEDAASEIIALLDSRSVLEPVAQTTGVSLTELEEMVVLESRASGRSLRVTTHAATDADALALAEAYSTRIINFISGLSRNPPAAALLKNEVQRATEEQEALQRQLRTLALSTSPSDAERLRQLRVRNDALEQKRADLEERIVEIRVASSSDVGVLRPVSDPYSVTDVGSGGYARAAAGGLAAGIVLAALYLGIQMLRSERGTGVSDEHGGDLKQGEQA